MVSNHFFTKIFPQNCKLQNSRHFTPIRFFTPIPCKHSIYKIILSKQLSRMEQLESQMDASQITEKVVSGKLMELKGLQLQQGLTQTMVINMNLEAYRKRMGLERPCRPRSPTRRLAETSTPSTAAPSTPSPLITASSPEEMEQAAIRILKTMSPEKAQQVLETAKSQKSTVKKPEFLEAKAVESDSLHAEAFRVNNKHHEHFGTFGCLTTWCLQRHYRLCCPNGWHVTRESAGKLIECGRTWSSSMWTWRWKAERCSAQHGKKACIQYGSARRYDHSPSAWFVWATFKSARLCGDCVCTGISSVSTFDWQGLLLPKDQLPWRFWSWEKRGHFEIVGSHPEEPPKAQLGEFAMHQIVEFDQPHTERWVGAGQFWEKGVPWFETSRWSGRCSGSCSRFWRWRELGVAYGSRQRLEEQSNSKTSGQDQVLQPPCLLVCVPWLCLWFGVQGLAGDEKLDSFDYKPACLVGTAASMSWSWSPWPCSLQRSCGAGILILSRSDGACDNGGHHQKLALQGGWSKDLSGQRRRDLHAWRFILWHWEWHWHHLGHRDRWLATLWAVGPGRTTWGVCFDENEISPRGTGWQTVGADQGTDASNSSS